MLPSIVDKIKHAVEPFAYAFFGGFFGFVLGCICGKASLYMNKVFLVGVQNFSDT